MNKQQNDMEKAEKLRLITALEKPSEVAILKHVDKIEEKTNAKLTELDEKIKEVKESFPTFEEVVDAIQLPEVQDGYTPVKGVDYDDGKPGENYVLTDQDKAEIATKIQVPIVEKVIETRTEVIKEQPIVTNQIVKEIKEVAIPETPEQIIEKVNAPGKQIKKERVEGLSDIERIAKENGAKMYTGVSETRVNELIKKIPLPAATSPALPLGSIQINIAGAFGSLGGAVLDTTGNTRGTGALDLQSLRSVATQVASGACSSAFGSLNTAAGLRSSAFGFCNCASACDSTALGMGNCALGPNTVAVGRANKASTGVSSAFGVGNFATNACASAFGSQNYAGALASSAFGTSNIAQGVRSSSIGQGNHVYAPYSSAIGGSNIATSSAPYGGAFGRSNVAGACGATALGFGVQSCGTFALAAGFSNGIIPSAPLTSYTGYCSIATYYGPYSAPPYFNNQYGYNKYSGYNVYHTAVGPDPVVSLAIGAHLSNYGVCSSLIGSYSSITNTCLPLGGYGPYGPGGSNASFACWQPNVCSTVIGVYNHSKGTKNTIVGSNNTTYAYNNVAIGLNNNVFCNGSTLFGLGNSALSPYAHGFGFGNTVGCKSVGVGYNNHAYAGCCSVALGVFSNAGASYSMVAGIGAIASQNCSFAFGTVSNNTACSAEFGPTNTHKINVANTGISLVGIPNTAGTFVTKGICWDTATGTLKGF